MDVQSLSSHFQVYFLDFENHGLRLFLVVFIIDYGLNGAVEFKCRGKGMTTTNYNGVLLTDQ